MLVSMGDREADIYELFHLALQDPHWPKLLVRAEQDRLVDDSQGHLWSTVASQPVAGVQEIHVPRRGPAPARRARLEVRFAEVTLKPPQDKSKYGLLKLWAVLAQETDAPEGISPLLAAKHRTSPAQSFVKRTNGRHWRHSSPNGLLLMARLPPFANIRVCLPALEDSSDARPMVNRGPKRYG